jgi:putative oxidoreductase
MDTPLKWVQLMGRIAVGAIFLVSAIGKLVNWSGTVAFVATKGVPEILLAGATALELLGALSLLAGFKTRWGVVALVIFLVPVSLVFHGFWAYQGMEQQQQLVHFMKNVAIGGGLLIVFAAGPDALSVDSRLARRSRVTSAAPRRSAAPPSARGDAPRASPSCGRAEGARNALLRRRRFATSDRR